MIALFSDERKITASGGDQLVLTNYRVNYSFNNWGSSSYESIFLEDISLVKTQYKSRMLYLYLAGLAVLAGLFKKYNNPQSMYDSGSNDDMVVFSFAIALILTILWFISRSRTIELYSHSGQSIELLVPQWNREEAMSFLETVQLTKAQRVFELYKEEVGR